MKRWIKAQLRSVHRRDHTVSKPPAERKMPEYGSEKDFQLIQAINQLKGQPDLISKTMVERPEEKKEE